MFKLIVKKGLYNLVLNTYKDNIHIYKNEIVKIIGNLSDNTTEKEMIILNFNATQKYYSFVFDAVCQNVSSNLNHFARLLPIKIASYSNSCDFNPDNLVAANIYDFVFWCLTNKHADSRKCIEINHLVNDLKNQCLLELDK